MWLKCLKNEKLLYFIGGVVAATLGVKAVKSATAREVCVKGLAKGMRLQQDAQETLQNMKEDAADLCHDAKQQAKTEKQENN